MEVRDAFAEDVRVDKISASCRLQCTRRPRQHRTERFGLGTVQRGDVGDVAVRLQMAESSDRPGKDDGQSPERVLPDAKPPELLVSQLRIT